MVECLGWWISEEKLLSLRPLKLFHRKTLLLNWSGMDLMGGVLDGLGI